MKYFLMLVIIGLGGAGYYEYTFFQGRLDADRQTISDLQAKVDSGIADNQKLEAANAQLKKSSSQAQGEIDNLTQQLATLQSALNQAKQQATQAKSSSTPGSGSSTGTGAGAGAAAFSDNLGSISTLDGKSYPNSQLLKFQADSIVINYPGGITQVPYSVLPPDLQKHFGFDPHQGLTLTDDQVQALEAKRKSAAQAAGN